MVPESGIYFFNSRRLGSQHNATLPGLRQKYQPEKMTS